MSATAPAGREALVRTKIMPYQRLPEGKDFWLMLMVTGRGTGKSWRGSSWIVKKAMQWAGTQGVVIGRTWGETRRVCAEGPSGVKAFILGNHLEELLEGGDWETAYHRSFPMELHFANGSILYFASADKPDSLRGLDVHYAWWDEACFAPEMSFKTFRPALRKSLPDGTPAQMLFTSTPDGENWVYDLYYKDGGEVPGVRFIGGENAGRTPPLKPPSTYDNVYLDPTLADSLKETYEGSDFARQELYGEFISLKGAIFTLDPIWHTRSGLESAEPAFEWPTGPEDCTQVVAGQDLGTVHPSAFVVWAKPKGTNRWCVVAEVVQTAQTEDDWSYAISGVLAKWKPTVIHSDINFPQTTTAQKRRGYPIKDTFKNPTSVSDSIRVLQGQLSSLTLAVDADACPVTWRQLKAYRWATDKNGDALQPERPVKKNDDSVDACRYVGLGVAGRRRKGLRIRG